MNLVSCEVVQDLIPLYVEDMLSEDSRKLVETHLDECEDCRKYLNELQKMNATPIETNAEPLKKIQKTIRKKKWYAIILTALITLLLGSLTVIHMSSPEYLSYSDKRVSINEGENGLVSITFNDEVAGYNVDRHPSENGMGVTYHLTTWTTTWHELTNAEELNPVILNVDEEQVDSVYYYQSDGNEDMLIFGEDQHADGGVVTLPRLSLNYVFILAVIALFVGLVSMFIVRSHKIYLERIMKITFLPLAYIVAQITITGWNATTYSSVRDFTAILLVASIVYGLMLVGLEFIKSYFLKKRNEL